MSVRAVSEGLSEEVGLEGRSSSDAVGSKGINAGVDNH